MEQRRPGLVGRSRTIAAARSAIVFVSRHHANTQRVAEAMARAIGADLLNAETTDPQTLTKYDLIGFGSGIYFGSPHRALRRLVLDLPPGTKRVFVFSTAGLPFLSRLWHCRLKRKLCRKGYLFVGEFSCRGWDTVGPLRLIGGLNRHHPSDDDLNRASLFARSLQENQ
jgi:flavodoxin